MLASKGTIRGTKAIFPTSPEYLAKQANWLGMGGFVLVHSWQKAHNHVFVRFRNKSF